MNTVSDIETESTRRDFLYSTSALVLAQLVGPKEASPRGTFGIVYTSFSIRNKQAEQALEQGEGPAIPAEKFIDLCKSFGGDGCQMDVAQLSSKEMDYLKRIRRVLDEKAMFLELSVNASVLEDAEAFAQMASVARELGVSRLRVAINGRRYEEFLEMKKWKDFVNHWQQVLQRSEPWARQHGLEIGIENHKDWMAEELAEILRRISSPHLGTCIDFGNNLALLEDPIKVSETLGPFAITTHLKDMALSETEEGFLLSEVPLGQGILPLAKMMEILRRFRPTIHFCLEMITRDPLKVPYRDDQYWVTYERRDATRIDRFKSSILSKSSAKSLPRIGGMSSIRMLAVEDDNIRKSVAYSKRTLGL